MVQDNTITVWLYFAYISGLLIASRYITRYLQSILPAIRNIWIREIMAISINVALTILTCTFHIPKRLFGSISYAIGYLKPVFRSELSPCDLWLQELNKLNRFQLVSYLRDRHCHGKVYGRLALQRGVWIYHVLYVIFIILLAIIAFLASIPLVKTFPPRIWQTIVSATEPTRKWYTTLQNADAEITKLSNSLEDIKDDIVYKDALYTVLRRLNEDQASRITELESRIRAYEKVSVEALDRHRSIDNRYGGVLHPGIRDGLMHSEDES